MPARTIPPSSVSLPSIHEMFPDHLFTSAKAQMSDKSSRLEHAAFGQSLLYMSDEPYGIYNDSWTPGSVDHEGSSCLGGIVDPYCVRRILASEERRHVCPTCGKAFNRPSSLGIHMNTHTGAKPFICAFPRCGRRFNVNSNMRRHFRNHAMGTKDARPSYSKELLKNTQPPEKRIAPQPKSSSLIPSSWPLSSPTSEYSDDGCSARSSDSETEEATHRMSHLRVKYTASPITRRASLNEGRGRQFSASLRLRSFSSPYPNRVRVLHPSALFQKADQ